jgi:8-oxo-dGTP pyrophosphatase MutT (NUDIX family)
MKNVIVVHAGESPPKQWTASLFLAGPTPRTPEVISWRPAALEEIERGWNRPGSLVVFVPEPRDEVWPEYDHQRTWELYWGDRCDVVLFWIPRGPAMPGLTTNDEWGRWKDSGRVILGTPPEADSVRYQRDYALDHHIPLADTLGETVASALAMIGSGADRGGGRRHVPLIVWRTPSFQSWLDAQERAGNELRAARLEWTFRIGAQSRKVFFWALHAEIYVRAEGRTKTNEIVLSRPDTSAVMAYKPASTVADTEIVLIREFRSPSSSSDGFVLELPGGSHPSPIDPATLALIELAEETGLDISPDRLVAHHSRQLAATVTAHRQFLYSVKLTEPEIDKVRHTTTPHGLTSDTEITYPQVLTVRDLIATGRADWTTLGAITEVLLGSAS